MRSLLISLVILLTASAAASAEEQAYFPYRLDPATDLVLASSGCAIAGTSIYLYEVKSPPGIVETLSARKSGLNPLDRSAAGLHTYGSATASTVLAGASAAVPLLLTVPLFTEHRSTAALTYLAMYAEVVVLNAGITGLCKGLVNRKRPFLYRTNVFDRKPRNADAAMSFYSLHTSIAFSSLVFMATVFGDMYRDPLYRSLVWIGSISTAGVTGILRVVSGNHFPTDIIAGAAAGSIIGCIVPLVHRIGDRRVTVAVIAGDTYGLSASLSF